MDSGAACKCDAARRIWSNARGTSDLLDRHVDSGLKPCGRLSAPRFIPCESLEKILFRGLKEMDFKHQRVGSDAFFPSPRTKGSRA